MTTPVFVDTSAVYAVLDGDDEHHEAAAEAWAQLLEGIGESEIEGVTHSSVLVEVTALVQRRLGMNAVRDLHDALMPALALRFVDEGLHRRAVTALLAANRRDVSLVDWTSFELMRELGATHALAFDDDFVVQGFEIYR